MEPGLTTSHSAEDEHNRRMAVRYDCIGLSGLIGEVKLKVLNMSLEGLAIETDQELPNPTDRMQITLKGGDCKKFSVVPTGKINGGNLNRYNFKFLRPQRPEKMGALNCHFSKPCECPISNRQRYNLQKDLAIKDIDTLQNSIQNLKNCQFQLLFAAIPILFGLLASIVAFVANKSGDTVHDFYYILPPVAIVLPFVLLAVFIQKMESIRRASAFTLILQRQLAMGSLPACYRGWHDAFENYNHLVRYGAKENSPFKVDPKEMLKHRNTKHSITKPQVPADSFTWLSVGLLTIIPIFSFALMIYILRSKVDDNTFSIESYTAIVFMSGAVFLAAIFWLFKKYKALRKGDRSFRYLIVLFSKLLKYAPPFDPYSNEPMCTHPKP